MFDALAAFYSRQLSPDEVTWLNAEMEWRQQQARRSERQYAEMEQLLLFDVESYGEPVK